jgi:hypothetical protein
MAIKKYNTSPSTVSYQAAFSVCNKNLEISLIITLSLSLSFAAQSSRTTMMTTILSSIVSSKIQTRKSLAGAPNCFLMTFAIFFIHLGRREPWRTY